MTGVVAGPARDELVRPGRRAIAGLAVVEVGTDQVLRPQQRGAACVEDEEVEFRRPCDEWLGARVSAMEQVLVGDQDAGPTLRLQLRGREPRNQGADRR